MFLPGSWPTSVGETVSKYNALTVTSESERSLYRFIFQQLAVLLISAVRFGFLSRRALLCTLHITQSSCLRSVSGECRRFS